MKLAQPLLALLLGVASLAQAIATENEATWYDVELILFKRGSAATGNTEQWPADPGSPDWDNSITLIPAEAEKTDQQPYTLLPRKEWRLTTLFNALQKRRGEIEPLFHQAWRQPVASAASAKAIYLGPVQRADATMAPFEGLIKISVSRYLHVELDLLLKQLSFPNSTPNNAGAVSSPSYGSVRFTANRRMRSGEVHYIDHPMMGALILISRIEVPQAQPESTATATENPAEQAIEKIVEPTAAPEKTAPAATTQ